MDFSAFLETTLQSSAEIARSYFGKVSSTTKVGDNNQVLTQADLEIGQHIIAQINEYFPTHNIIDEEAGVADRHSEFTWVIDPIDGTSNFAQGIPTYGIMMGLLKNNRPIAGGAVLPFFNEVYIAEKGQGSYCNNQKIHVTSEKNLLSVLAVYNIDGHQENPDLTFQECQDMAKIILQIRNVRTSGSIFDIAMVIKGKYGAALNRTSKIWDNVAQHILMEEAGGLYTDFFGQPMEYTQPLLRVNQNFTYCAAAPQLHTQLQTIIHSQN